MKYLTRFWLFLLFFLSGGSSFATHAIGGEMTYRCLGSNQYEITYVFYRDCGALAAPSMMSLNVTNSCGYTNPFTFLTPVSSKKINFTCTPNLSDCNSGGYFGVERWVYRGTITLNGPCDDWTFSHTESSRSQMITTLQANSNLYVYARVDNTQGCFDSPVFREPNLPVSCLYNSYCADNLVDKTNSDLIIYNLITPLIAPGTNATYSSLSYTATQPISTDLPPVFDSLTGTICFQPNTVEFG